jgi:hypothetical protein
MTAPYPDPLPYAWRPAGARQVALPDPGQMLGWRHALWRVLEVTPVPPGQWTREDQALLERCPVGARQVTAPHTIVITPVTGPAGTVRLRRRAGATPLFVYPGEHYPVCAACREPVPCREEMARRVSAASVQRIDRYLTPGVCPACLQPVSSRQRAITFGENVEIPAGPPVTYHLRRRCAGAAMRYEKRWAAAVPGRRTVLSCTGHIQHHLDGAECSHGPACPGPGVPHGSAARCERDRLDGCLRCLDVVTSDDWASPGTEAGTQPRS